MTIHIAINGFGRIRRSVIRALCEIKRQKKINVVAINKKKNINLIPYLLEYDTTQGKFPYKINKNGDILKINKDRIKILQYKKINQLSWKELKINIVLDCTGTYKKTKNRRKHLLSGIKKFLFSYPGNKNIDKIIVFGINHKNLKQTDNVISNASCTSNCAIPIIKILDDKFGVKHGFITIIHPSMNDQNIIDNYNNDLNLIRSSIHSIIPINTNLTKNITKILPTFKNKFTANAIRIPTTNVIASILNIFLKDKVNIYNVNSSLENASKKKLKRIMKYTELPLISNNFNHDSHSAIIDGRQNKTNNKNLVKILAWCDNEWGFANRMIDTTLVIASKFL
ncbi:erythrose-4-phosphate dehydrogenase [Candidatus Purcelliella pentastirinorum]|uniref:Erythrose-4-phosphate dehydrogenase n=2 Tax=Candidatus Purcelliella pentastirinorum TaxID=472834 RepID=A0AAX3N7T0_9ENTR|nr:glyceraldehyde 3-phosphate dehydrogenase NAD-binding domain-containing protein [Candidatus Purcelliella pentastirinorum]WDI78676.1 erythrose-4-phosphate dehydrogenase [Candidatus Purcelliella pentastirinorum]